jgi:alpha-D-ribose 1-methylphosphonate 5-triphosphate synthase subunit PhnH
MDPVADTRRTFRALVDAVARPGTVQTVPVGPADRAVIATLVDHEVTLWSDDEELTDRLAGEGRFDPAPLPEADVVHTTGEADGAITVAHRGTLKEPSDGATVVYRVDALSMDGDPAADTPRLSLAGPGVPDRRELSVEGFSVAEVEAFETATTGFPRGVDVVLTDAERVAALPRTATVEVM